METRANYTLIGAFTLLVIAGAFGFVYWLSGTDSAQRRVPLRVVFSGSVGGLAKGSFVTFNGIRVGEATDIRLMPQDPRRVVAIVEVDRQTPLRTDTRARLDLTLLTGVTSIALTGGEASAPALTPNSGDTMPTIFADSSDIQDLLASARVIAQRADDLLSRVDRVVSENEGTIGRTLANAERFSQALSDNSAAVSGFLEGVGKAAERIGPLSVKIEALATTADDLLRSVDRTRVAGIVENAQSFTKTLADNKAAIDAVLQETAGLTRQLNAAAPKLDAALADAGTLLKSVDAARLNHALEGADKFATALSNSSGDVERGLSDARQLAEKLNRSADRVDGVLAAAQNFLGSAAGKEGESTFGEVRQAAHAIRVLAENLDKRTAEITTSFTRLSGSGKREVEALSSDGRRTLNDLSRAVRSLERNPSQVIFGASPTLPEYNARR